MLNKTKFSSNLVQLYTTKTKNEEKITQNTSLFKEKRTFSEEKGEDVNDWLEIFVESTTYFKFNAAQKLRFCQNDRERKKVRRTWL